VLAPLETALGLGEAPGAEGAEELSAALEVSPGAAVLETMGVDAEAEAGVLGEASGVEFGAAEEETAALEAGGLGGELIGGATGGLAGELAGGAGVVSALDGATGVVAGGADAELIGGTIMLGIAVVQ